MALQIEPGLRISPEISPKPQRGIGRDRPLAVNNLVDSPRRNTDGLGQRVLAEPQRTHEIFQQDLAGMNGFDIALVHGAYALILASYNPTDGLLPEIKST